MKMKWNFQRIAALATTTAMFALVGCASTRYERTTGEFVDDKMLSGRVKHALNDQPVYKYPDVKVQTYRGVVQLSGFVATEAQRNAATEIARRARGVRQIENNILIAPLEQAGMRDYIPGRTTTNEVDRATGAPSSITVTNTGSSTR